MRMIIYVGSLTRYYIGDWQVPGELPAPTVVLKPASEDDPRSVAEQVRTEVTAWQFSLRHALRTHHASLSDLALEWEESAQSFSHVSHMPLAAYAALLLRAAYDEQHLAPPVHMVSDWTHDPALRASTDPSFHSRYAQLLYGTQLWLPAHFDLVFSAPDAGSQTVLIGSLESLAQQLRALNAHTWQMEENRAALSQHLDHLSNQEATLDALAQYGFIHLWLAADIAREAHLPMRIDLD